RRLERHELGGPGRRGRGQARSEAIARVGKPRRRPPPQGGGLFICPRQFAAGARHTAAAIVRRMSLRTIALLLAAVPGLAYGHAVVTPAESSAGQAQQYTLHVPNEK